MADNFEQELSRSEKLLKERLIRAGKIARDITNQSFKELLNTIDDYSSAIDDITEKLNKQLINYDNIKLSTRQYGDALKSTLPFIKENKDLTQKLTQIYVNNNKLANKLVENQEDLITGQLSLNNVAKDIAKIRQQQLNIELSQRDIAQEIEVLNNEAVGLQGEELENIQFKLEALREINEQLEAEKENSQTIADNLQKQAESASEIETKVGLGGKLLSGFKKIPVLGDILDVDGAKDAMQAAAANGASSFGTLGAGVKALGPSLKAALGPLALITLAVEAIQALVKAMFEADKRVTDIAKNLNISKEAARGVYSNLIGIKKEVDDIRFGTKDLIEAFNDISQLTEFTTIATKDQVKTQVELVKLLGFQKEDALALQEIFAINNIESEKGVDLAYDQIAAFTNRNKIEANGQKILSEVAKTSKLIQLNFKGNTAELIQTTLEAKKLGLNLDQVNKIADTLLDFESSISAELEAELLTGRNINLEKAREFALNNDIAGLTQEIAKQGITSSKFSNMNRIQQEAIAKTLGMSSNELADSLYKQELIEKTAGNTTKQLREQAKLARINKDFASATALEKKAAAIEQGILDGKSLQDAQKQYDAQTKFNESVERVKEIFTDLVDGGAIDTLASFFERMAFTLSKGGSLFDILTGDIASTSEIAASKKQSLQEQAKTAKGDQKETIENQIKEQSGIILNEKYKKEKESFESNPFSKLFGLKYEDTKAFDYYKKQYEAEGLKIPKLAKGGIVTQPTKAIIGEAGPEAVVPLNKQLNVNLDPLVEKINTLISIVEKGGHVYLDGNKVGTAMAMGTFKTQ
jgi:hypothetical protein